MTRCRQGEVVSNHDELMSNFFAQADALAVGKTPVELRSENVPDALIPHKTFTGNRPSSSLMLPDLSAYTTGQILALYEHNTAVMVRAARASVVSLRRVIHADSVVTYECGKASARNGRESFLRHELGKNATSLQCCSTVCPGCGW